ncbi:MAG: uracil-DNA glycosylase family protein, partial [Dehalococcoidia bacterium]|nr:uracil-DNA glycosylase family protein [Dehalococcoidia bacterium]
NNRRPAGREVAACRGFLAETHRLVRAPVVVALGVVALDALRRIEPHEAVLARDVGHAIDWAGRTLVPLYHPSIQSTLTRPHDAQRRDWRLLGQVVRSGMLPQRTSVIPSPSASLRTGSAKNLANQ